MADVGAILLRVSDVCDIVSYEHVPVSSSMLGTSHDGGTYIFKLIVTVFC